MNAECRERVTKKEKKKKREKRRHKEDERSCVYTSAKADAGVSTRARFPGVSGSTNAVEIPTKS